MSDLPTVIDYKPTIINTLSTNSIGTPIGNQITSGTAFASAAWPSASLAFFIPFRIAQPYTVANVYWFNGATVGTNTVQGGVYDSQGNQLVVSTAATSAGISTIQSASLTATTLQRGLYYMALVINGTTATVRAAAIPVPVSRAWGVYTMVSATPLPTSATFAGNTTAYVPFIGITSSSVV